MNNIALIVKVSAYFFYVRSGFAQLLGLEPDLQVVAEFGSGREALAGLPGRGVQVCICDISMPDISGLELLSQLPKGMATIMLSVHDSPALVEQALNAGARGFLSKRCSPDELIAAVHTVATGGCYLTPDIAIKLASGRQDPLTKRERQVAEKLAQGMAVKEIAAELGLSPKTVHVHPPGQDHDHRCPYRRSPHSRQSDGKTGRQ